MWKLELGFDDGQNLKLEYTFVDKMGRGLLRIDRDVHDLGNVEGDQLLAYSWCSDIQFFQGNLKIKLSVYILLSETIKYMTNLAFE